MIQVAKIGKTVGVYGGLKLHSLTDFPEIFQEKVKFFAKKEGIASRTFELQIKHYHQGNVAFVGYEDLESAKMLTNALLFVSIEDTHRFCLLKEGEAFWFDVIGCEIIEEEEILGKVKEIERIAQTDYLIIEANTHGKKLPKCFMIPYIDRYILSASFKEKKIFTQGAKEIWFAS